MTDLLDRPVVRRRHRQSGDLITDMSAAIDALSKLNSTSEQVLTVIVRWEQLLDKLATEAGDRRARMRTISEVESQIDFLEHQTLAYHRPAFIAAQVLRWVLVQMHEPPAHTWGLPTEGQCDDSDVFLDRVIDRANRAAGSAVGFDARAAWQALDEHLRDGGRLPTPWLAARPFGALTTEERKFIIKNGGRSA
jgi:hypothetical protein